MKLTSIEFTGYKRLRSTKCNVEGRTVAFIGPNESGKSSVLEGLEWLTNGLDDELSITAKNRQSPPSDEDYAVRSYFRLEPDDQAALAALAVDANSNLAKVKITEFRVSKRADGTVVTGVTPRILRNPKPFENAARANAALRVAATGLNHLDDGNDFFANLPAVLDGATELLDPTNNAWGQDRRDRLNGLRGDVNKADELLSAIENPNSHEKKGDCCRFG